MMNAIIAYVLFGGSGGEILLCENLKHKWISCELHKPYFEMINDRLQSNGTIKNEFRLPNFTRKNYENSANKERNKEQSLFENAL